MPISRNLHQKLMSLPRTPLGSTGVEVIKDFGILIETHQDDDGARPQFRHSFIRGWCAPVLVHLEYGPGSTPTLWNDDLQDIDLDYADHRFMTTEGWSKFNLDFFIENGRSPIETGTMPTRYLRDARKKVYLLRSFRQIVDDNYRRAKAAGTLVKP